VVRGHGYYNLGIRRCQGWLSGPRRFSISSPNFQQPPALQVAERWIGRSHDERIRQPDSLKVAADRDALKRLEVHGQVRKLGNASGSRTKKNPVDTTRKLKLNDVANFKRR
jgi:hypothetical protein